MGPRRARDVRPLSMTFAAGCLEAGGVGGRCGVIADVLGHNGAPRHGAAFMGNAQGSPESKCSTGRSSSRAVPDSQSIAGSKRSQDDRDRTVHGVFQLALPAPTAAWATAG